MTKNILHNLKMAIQLTLVTLLLASCFVIDRSLFNGIITAKGLWVQLIAIISVVFVTVQVLVVKQFKIKVVDTLVSLLFLWMILRDGFNGLSHANANTYLIQICIYFCLYVFLRLIANNKETIKGIIVLYLLIVTTQAIIGLLQLYGLLDSHHALFKITGTFHNPGPFSGFVVSGLPMGLALYLMTKSALKVKKSHVEITPLKKSLVIGYWSLVTVDRVLNYFAQFVIIILLLVLPAARSRAAWLGGIVGCLFVILYQKEPLIKYTKRLKETLRNSALPLWFSAKLKRYAVSLMTLLFFFSLFGLYKYKQGSADGRLLMWQVSWEMIKDKPILGWGQGGFQANYANYQAEWFSSGKGTEAQALVAGSPDAPFNELIRVAVNYGFVGVILVFVLLIILFLRGSRRTTEVHGDPLRNSVISKGGLVSILVFSLFSYTLDIAPMIIQLLLLTAIIANQTEYRLLNTEYYLSKLPLITDHRLPITKIAATLLLITIIPIAILNLKNLHSGLTHWQEANELYKYELYSDASEGFELALQYLPKEGLLLQMQAKCFSMFNEWDKAINTASVAQNYTNGQILNIVLGDSYRARGTYKQSEQAYLHASAIIPHKFFPEYLLVKMYDESGQKDKLEKHAHELLSKKVKVQSEAIMQMEKEIKKLLQK